MSQLLALLGVVLIIVAVIALTDWRWGVLGAGIVLLVSAWATWTQENG